MMGIGAMEILVIIVVTLLVVGPEKMPELARTLARLMRDVRHMMDDARDQIEEITREELLNKKDVDSYYKDVRGVVDSVKDGAKKLLEPPAELKSVEKEIQESMQQIDEQIDKQLDEPAEELEQPKEPEKPENPPAQPSP